MTSGVTAVEMGGSWIAGPRQGVQGRVIDFRAGNLIVADDTGNLTFGPPEAFRADSSATGDALMELLLPSPTVDELYRGCLRESLAMAWSTARLGHIETRAWDRQAEYIVDNSEGCLAFICFEGTDCVGAAYSDDPSRPYDIHAVLTQVPERLRSRAVTLAQLPFFSQNGTPEHTALFWSDRGRLVGEEPWHVLYTYSGDVLRSELLAPATWRAEVAENYEMPGEVADNICRAIRQIRLPAAKVLLGAELLNQLIPAHAPHTALALELLSSGAFDIRGWAPAQGA